MAGRAAMSGVGGLAALAVGLAVQAADPVPAPPTFPAPPAAPTLPTDLPPLPEPTRTTTSYQPPPAPPPAPAPVPPPVDRPEPPRDPLAPFLPQPPTPSEVVLPNGARVNLPASTRQFVQLSARYGQNYNLQRTVDPEDKDKERWIITGGVIVNVVFVGNAQTNRPQEVEFATDNAVIWVKGARGKNPATGFTAGGDEQDKTEVEFFLAGHVVIRTLSTDGTGGRTVDQVFRAKEVYYEVSKNRAIALSGDLELRVSGIPDSFHLRGREVWQLGPNEWRAIEADAYSSKRPADPGLRFTTREATLTQQETQLRNVFGIPYRNLRTGEPEYGYERILTTRSAWVRVFDTPVLWYPRSRTDINEPLGPLAGVGFGNDRIFGTQIYTTWNLYNLLALRPPQGHKWNLYLDYLSDRGPAFGTEYDYSGPDFFGFGNRHAGLLKFYEVFDKGEDVLGGDRGLEPIKPYHRYRFQWRHNQDLFEDGVTFARWIAQVESFSDKNFFEQFYRLEFQTQPNQETFSYVYGADGNLGGSVLVEGNLYRRWMTETEWWPKLDGYLIGESFLGDRLVYSARANAGYAELKPATDPPPPVLPTDVKNETGRFDLQQKLSAPFDAGPLRLEPYGIMDLAYYTDDLTGTGRGRFYGGGGAKASMTLSRLYPDAESELFNVRGLNHKINLGANYYAAHSDTPYTRLPQLDRLNDDVTDFSYRLTRPRQQDKFTVLPDGTIQQTQTGLVPGLDGVALSNSPIFDPQQYAIRRLVMNRVDTLDSIQVLQLDARQRLQTKRGFPGAEHIVDWLSLDLSMSVFPDPNRDNYGKTTAFQEYSAVWNVGDRTSLTSAGWFDPFDFGTRYYNVGINFNRPDGTVFTLTYRHTDPLHSRAVTATANYQLTRKYSVYAVSTYDFGLNRSLSNQISFARVGTDVTVLFGFTYNAIVNNFGLQFAIVPNLIGSAIGRPGPLRLQTFNSSAALGTR